MNKKEKDTGYTSYWKHKRAYGKRVLAKKSRQSAKKEIDKS